MDTKAATNGTAAQPQPAPPPPTTAIEKRAPLAFSPMNVDEAWRIAGMLAKADLLPDAFREKPNNVLLVLMMGHELGLSPMQALRQIYVVKGKPYISSALKMALVKQSAACVYFRCIETNAERATFETERRDEGKTTLTFTIEQARKAGLLAPSRSGEPSNWDKYPEVMLRWRAGSALADLVYSDIVGNIGAKEDLPPAEQDRGYLERVVPEVTAPPVPVVVVSAPTEAPTAPAPAKAPETPDKDRLTIKEVPLDPLEAEVQALKKGIDESKTKKEALQFSARIMALPPDLKADVSRHYEQRAKTLPAK